MDRLIGLPNYMKSDRFNSIFFRNLLLIFMVIIVPLSSITYLFYDTMTDTLNEEITSVNSYALYRVRDVIDNIYRDINQMAIALALDEDLSGRVM